eukprot:TRINITY_DN39101_c0_g1_i1.p1 TRINITY_DN39101_c0_g1~~TRINITY_DN39101_c0_g1_i1.p1  ORF type:complete len:173 (+),score=69.55 TRINITY_DN39101_c0_g1_i1:47-520(+)
MGNCSGTPAGTQQSAAPEPKLDARKLGLDCRKTRNATMFKDIQQHYAEVKEKVADDNKAKDEVHEEVMKDKRLVYMIERFSEDMDYTYDISRTARNEQDRMLSEMGDENPERNLSDVPGARKAWDAAKAKAIKKAVLKVTADAVEEQLKQCSVDAAA